MKYQKSKSYHRTFILIALLFFSIFKVQAQDLMLLNSYENQNISGWVMSEKLDGVRGFWNGKELITRQKVKLSPPDYFTQDFPPFAIDGELFSERGKFEEISAITRSLEDKGWHKLKLYVFDVPEQKGDLFERLAVLENYLKQHRTSYIEIIPQLPVENHEQLQHFLQKIEQLGGEGVVVRNPKAPYMAGRSSQILKVKTTYDEECTVIAHHQGKGKFADKLGAITCENHRGQFRIGSGFNNQERLNPPAIGSTITYKYRGLTNKGKPKFATYWRQRKEGIGDE